MTAQAIYNRIRRISRAITKSNVLNWGRAFYQLIGTKRSDVPVGMYEVLEYESRLELKDSKGKRATHRKRQRVRFLLPIIKIPLFRCGLGK